METETGRDNAYASYKVTPPNSQPHGGLLQNGDTTPLGCGVTKNDVQTMR